MWTYFRRYQTASVKGSSRVGRQNQKRFTWTCVCSIFSHIWFTKKWLNNLPGKVFDPVISASFIGSTFPCPVTQSSSSSLSFLHLKWLFWSCILPDRKLCLDFKHFLRPAKWENVKDGLPAPLCRFTLQVCVFLHKFCHIACARISSRLDVFSEKAWNFGYSLVNSRTSFNIDQLWFLLNLPWYCPFAYTLLMVPEFG